MNLAIMQPYFFPYLGYFSLIKASDRFVIFDTIQYIRHGWMNRNRILRANGGWQYIGIPLKKHARSTLIVDVEVSGEDWKNRILRQLAHYRQKANNYSQVMRLLDRCFDTSEKKLAKLNVRFLRLTCEYVKLKFEYEVFSEMKMSLGDVEEAGDWALAISQQLKATQYINPPGGEKIFDIRKFKRQEIELSFLSNRLSPYPQKREEFVAGLSIIDVLMNNDVDQTMKLIEDYEVKSAV